LVRDPLEEHERVLQMGTAPQEIPTLRTSQLDARHILHWLGKWTWWRYHVLWKNA
jgi:hypothetical protein